MLPTSLRALLILMAGLSTAKAVPIVTWYQDLPAEFSLQISGPLIPTSPDSAVFWAPYDARTFTSPSGWWSVTVGPADVSTGIFTPMLNAAYVYGTYQFGPAVINFMTYGSYAWNVNSLPDLSGSQIFGVDSTVPTWAWVDPGSYNVRLNGSDFNDYATWSYVVSVTGRVSGAPVPDEGPTAALLLLGLAGVDAFRRRGRLSCPRA